MGGAYALDFGAVLLMAEAMDAATPLLADMLPRIEPILVKAYRGEGDDHAGNPGSDPDWG